MVGLRRELVNVNLSAKVVATDPTLTNWLFTKTVRLWITQTYVFEIQ